MSLRGENPKFGLHYEDAKQKAKHFAKLKAKDKTLQKNLINSILNQADLHNKGAAKEIRKEMEKDNWLR